MTGFQGRAILLGEHSVSILNLLRGTISYADEYEN